MTQGFFLITGVFYRIKRPSISEAGSWESALLKGIVARDFFTYYSIFWNLNLTFHADVTLTKVF
jgi:hypothetical protein